MHQKHRIGNLPQPANDRRLRPALDQPGVPTERKRHGNRQRDGKAYPIVEQQGGNDQHKHQQQPARGGTTARAPAGQRTQAVSAEKIDRPVIQTAIAVEVEQRGDDQQQHQPDRQGSRTRPDTLCQPEDAGQQGVKLEVDGHVPDPGREPVKAEHTLQQEAVGNDLGNFRNAGRGRMIHQATGDGRRQHRQQQGHQIGANQFEITPPEQRR